LQYHNKLMNYYNEYDKKAAAWLRELIKVGAIPDGHVDERSIAEVSPDDLRGFTQCHFFAGIGGWSLALQLAGWSSERPVWTGSCPCQPFSAAGKGLGAADERHLWPAWFHLIRECRPNVVFGEQVAGAVGHGWLDLVSSDLESQGYAIGAAVLGAHSVGAPHIRQRLYFVADSSGERGARLRDAEGFGELRQGRADWPVDLREVYSSPYAPGASHPQPLLRRSVDGIPARVVRLRGYGNAIVPQCAQAFIEAFLDIQNENMHKM
jgi:DNA (cytosine-5)-methyltransferase 1